MSGRVYRLSFWKDYVWVYLILALIGLGTALLGLYLPFIPLPPKDADSRLGFACIIFPFISLPIIIGGWLIFWVFLFAFDQKVIFTDESVAHYRFRIFLPWHTEIRIPFKDVVSVVLSTHMKKKLFPETKTMGFGGLGDGSEFIIYYTSEGKVLNESMPRIRKKEYYEEVRKLVEEVKTKNTKP
ncbi:MAG: hypothetical protein NTU61_01190 [Candidatus Altiarchaeota archaeon]|nr:hypothetical protein [Candidatus Altiarchaeota archaeon]